MKINEIIRRRRKELSLTQEQIAEYLGVSAPAVHKWEKGSTYPDITLLPALARLLKTDLNTLLSFHEDLSDTEVEKFVDELDRLALEEGYEATFETGIKKMQEYPTCESLIYLVTFYLEGALLFSCVSEPEPYQKILEDYFKRLSQSTTPEIRDSAIQMLISYHRNRKEYAQAEELIRTIPTSIIDPQQQFAILYTQQEKYEDAQINWESYILKNITSIQGALSNMLEIAWKEGRTEDALFFADLYETLSQQCDLPKWMAYNAPLQITLLKQDVNACLTILEEMLPAMKEEWNPKATRLYPHLNGDGGSSFLSNRLVEVICDDLQKKEEYAFLHETERFWELIKKYSSTNSPF